jgi:hypothetical protein
MASLARRSKERAAQAWREASFGRNGLALALTLCGGHPPCCGPQPVSDWFSRRSIGGGSRWFLRHNARYNTWVLGIYQKPVASGYGLYHIRILAAADIKQAPSTWLRFCWINIAHNGKHCCRLQRLRSGSARITLCLRASSVPVCPSCCARVAVRSFCA